MRPFPEPYKVRHEPILTGATDDWGDSIEGFGPAVEVSVIGWAPAGADQPIRDLGTGIGHDVDLYCSTPFAKHRDKVTLPTEPLPLEVQGNPEDFNTGPFGFTPGYRIKLKRVEG